ncbi:MAG: peptidoglycan-binding domain-containing protein [Minisyncoccia bacterium]
MKRIIFATGVAVLALALVAGAQGQVFNVNLTVGSTGSDVVALQTALMSAGYNIPWIASGAAAKGYFGSQTKAAVMQYQAAHGVPNTGFVGPLTRAALNGGAMTVGGTTCPAGYTCTLTGSPVTGGSSAGGITTPGVPGIMTSTAGPLSSAVLNVGAQQVPVITVRVQAQYSDLDVQSLTLDLGNNTSAFNKLFNTVYVTDGTNVLSSQALNGSTVVQSGSEYILGLAGFHFFVPRGTYKDLVIKGSLNTSIDTAYLAGGAHFPDGVHAALNSINGIAVTGWGIGVVANGVRAVDGAGLNLYGPTTGFNQVLTINASLVDNAQANVSLDAASPLVASVPVSDTTNGNYLGLPVLIFDVNAQNDTLHLHEVKVQIGTVGAVGSVGAAYLYNGSTMITSASVSGGIADFNNIVDGTSGATIPVNTTVPFTVKVDVTGVTGAGVALSVVASTTGSVGAAPLSIYNSIDSTAAISGSAVGNTQTVAAAGPLFQLSGTPTIVKSVLSSDQNGNATDSYTATFNVQVTSIGQNINFALPASTTGAMFLVANAANNAYATTSLSVYKNGSMDWAGIGGNTNGLGNYWTNGASVVANYSQPTNTTISSNGLYFTLAQNQTVTIPVTLTWLVKNPGANTYAAQLQGINWLTNALAPNSSIFMANQTAWRSPAI